MPESLPDSRLQSLGRETLTPVVRSALQDVAAEVIDWTYQPLSGGLGIVADLYRFSGHALVSGCTTPWSLVLKVINLSRARDVPLVFSSVNREPLAYRSGILSQLPGDLRAPRLLAIEEQPGEACWLWLEEISEETGLSWTLERYALAARHLGQFNGAYLERQSLPDWPWLSRHWLRTWVAQVAMFPVLARTILRETSREGTLPHDFIAGMLRVWESSSAWLAVIERLPQTLCHLDAFRRNLFAHYGPDGQEQTVAIDWAFMGLGALGEELAPLVSATVTFFEADAAQVYTLDRLVFEGYLQGLRDVGWRGDTVQVRFAYAAASPLRYGIILANNLLRAENDESLQSEAEKVLGRPYSEIVKMAMTLLPFHLELADEARALQRSVAASIEQA